MDERFKIPLLIIAWAIAITVIAFVVLIVYGTILAIRTPEIFT